MKRIMTQPQLIILYGNPAENIVDFADKNNIDLIVMGSQGLSVVSKIFKGIDSVSRKVSERFSCPIVIIRQKTRTF